MSDSNKAVSTMVDSIKPISVFFKKDWEIYFESLGVNVLSGLTNDYTAPWTIKMCSSWEELSDVLKCKPHQIIFHIEMIDILGTTVYEFVSMIETLIKVTGGEKIPIAIAIQKNTPLNFIKELNKNNIIGIVPSAKDFGLIESYKGLEALFNRIPYYPKHILEQLPGAKKTVTKNTIVLTPRQAQVVELIATRGLSNKKIAQVLNITESTVKIHVSAILKCYGVRTRTQLALVASK